MKRLYLILFAVIPLMAALVACKRLPPDGITPAGAAPSGPAPKLVFAEMSHDFGTVVAGQTVEHVFAFRNEGKGELRLEKPRGS